MCDSIKPTCRGRISGAHVVSTLFLFCLASILVCLVERLCSAHLAAEANEHADISSRGYIQEQAANFLLVGLSVSKE